jgi:hypothetical protein
MISGNSSLGIQVKFGYNKLYAISLIGGIEDVKQVNRNI